MTGTRPDLPLSRLMREGSRPEHTAAEETGFMQSLLHGTADRADYVRYLAALARIYETLEQALSNAQEPDALVRDPRLYRFPALQDDLEFFTGSRDAESSLAAAPEKLQEAIREYQDAIRAAAGQREGLLIAHAYVRYFGDLSGGQILANRIAERFSLNDDTQRGLQFYQFPQIPDTTAFKADYRRRLDALPLSDAQTQRLVEETRLAFRHNIAIFERLG